MEAGFLLRRLQKGETLTMPHARPMPSIGPNCYELRITDQQISWRIIYRVDPDAIVLLEVFEKKNQANPASGHSAMSTTSPALQRRQTLKGS
jgi:phage-related protein